LKPGGQFVAQVGLDDHLAFFQGHFGSKRYLRYSERAWRILIGNSVQYINRLTSSQIIGLLTDAGFSIDSIETDSSGDTAPGEVHPDYRNQSEADIRTVRLMVQGPQNGERDRGGRDGHGLVGAQVGPQSSRRRDGRHAEIQTLRSSCPVRCAAAIRCVIRS
jgi:hypothetical protein